MVHETLAAAPRRQRSDLSAASNRMIRAVRMRAQYAAENEENGYWLGYCASNHSGTVTKLVPVADFYSTITVLK